MAGHVDKIMRRLLTKVDDRKHARTKGTLRAAIEAFMETHEMELATRRHYRLFDKQFIGPALSDQPVSKIDARARNVLRRAAPVSAAMRRAAVHRAQDDRGARMPRCSAQRPPCRRPAGGYPEHDCAKAGCKVIECRPHECDPLPPGTILKIHYALSAIFAATVRWAGCSRTRAT
ncbi:hypothetical protein [Amycolatopsis pithecellobii]|uniref:Integrase SAM-like N-terminal domain-containing protein n=1 Tax=Amycolatopsis pithecellobii TaxID=664692 RepID=A0A6N7ZAS4_9PSEU|nr:hypothetical protein [Amycolatopsis pithecellobii]MTD58775.1 hypothetical protein [Amycolatopsis pithecellobii]